MALWLDGRLVEREVNAGQRHSLLLLGMVDDVLKEGGITLGELDGIAYGEGPGSFTGLRIGCGVTQGLAFVGDVPVVGVGTLLAMAEEIRGEHVVCALDARMKEIYHAAYERSGNAWSEVYAPGVYPPHAAPLLHEGEWVACGSGFAAYRDALESRYAGRLIDVRPDVYPRARHIARLSVAGFDDGSAVSAEHVVPRYVRNKVALRSDERPA